MIAALAVSLGAFLLGALAVLLQSGRRFRRYARSRGQELAALAECNRHTALATDALRRKHDEAYEFHMIEAVKALDRSIEIGKKRRASRA